MKLAMKGFDQDINKMQEKMIEMLNSVSDAVKFALKENPGSEAYNALADFAGTYIWIIVSSNLIRFTDTVTFFEECGLDACTARDIATVMKYAQAEQRKKEAGMQLLMF